MKLRNKKTGEIVEVKSVRFYCENEDGNEYQWSKRKEFDGITIAELNEEWEDYEEPKDDCIRVIESFINYVEEADESFYCDETVQKFAEKLKAWKRLKDKGFKFIGKTYETDKRFGSIFYGLNKDTYSEDIIDDLDLLFGGEE